ncbi:uncharacterized protein JCM6883_007414 [Sporobolomyces salmoneus]|uniref:uncharacterized protein n=1 Tax=Sporobolomyces salmoneus TaxID=183962 RepID=UPI00317B0A02
MPKHAQGKKNKQGGNKGKQNAKDKAKAKARTIVEKGKQLLPSTLASSSSTGPVKNVETSFVEHVATSDPTSRSTNDSYPRSIYNDDLSVQPLHPAEIAHPSTISETSSSRRSSFTGGRVMVEEGGYYDTEDGDDEGYHADYRSDLGDEFYTAGDEFEEETEDTVDQLPINRYDGLVYVTDGSSSRSSSLSSASSSESSAGGMDDELEEAENALRRRRQATLGNSETSWEDGSPATSTSQALYSPPPNKSTKLADTAQLPEYRYAPVTASFSYPGPSYDPNQPPSLTTTASTTATNPHDLDSYSSQLVETYTQSVAPSPVASRENSGSSTPRGRNPHPRLLWRSQLSAQIIDALDNHHRKIAGCSLPRIKPQRSRQDVSTLDVVPEREGTGKLDVEVRERDKERERGRMDKNRRPLSREGRRWSRAVEKWGL